MFGIHCSVFVANELGHDGCTVSRILAMEDQKCFGGGLDVEELGRQVFLVVEVHRSINVAALVFIFEPAVNNDELLVKMIEFAVQDLDQRLFGDSRKAVGLV